MVHSDQQPDRDRSKKEISNIEQDPEKAWKNNPNPWQQWDRSAASLSKSNFIKEPDWSRYDTNPPKLKWWGKFLLKLIVALLLFFGTWGMFHSNDPWAKKGQTVVRQVLTEEFDFASISAWYSDNFIGSPSLLPSFSQQREEMIQVDSPVVNSGISPLEEGSLISTFADLLNGIELAAPALSPVRAIASGRVILVSDEQATVIIQHASKRISIYTGLGSEVRVNDWVDQGDLIGSLLASQSGSHSLLYFAIKEDDRYIDPLDVIAVD